MVLKKLEKFWLILFYLITLEDPMPGSRKHLGFGNGLHIQVFTSELYP